MNKKRRKKKKYFWGGHRPGAKRTGAVSGPTGCTKNQTALPLSKYDRCTEKKKIPRFKLKIPQDFGRSLERKR